MKITLLFAFLVNFANILTLLILRLLIGTECKILKPLIVLLQVSKISIFDFSLLFSHYDIFFIMII